MRVVSCDRKKQAHFTVITAIVIREMHVGLPSSFTIRISHTSVLPPIWIGRAVPVTHPEATARKWLALISSPTARWFSPRTQFLYLNVTESPV